MTEDKYGLAIELSLDTNDLETNLKKVKEELKTSKESMRSIDKELKENPKNVNAWRQKQELLNKTIEQTKDKMKLQEKQLEQLNKEFDGSERASKKINNLKLAIVKTTNEIKRMGIQANEAQRHLEDASKVKFENLGSIGGVLTKGITLPIVGAMTALGGVAMNTADKIDEIADNASRVGASVEGYQELIYVTKLLGGNSDALQRGFIKINSMMGDIASGNSLKAAQTLSKLGLTIEDVKGKDTTEVFKILREEIAKLGDEALMADMANQIFGDRIGSELLPVLKADAETIQGLTNEAHELGIANKKQIEIAGEFNDELDKLKQAFFGVQVTIMEMILPSLKKLVTYFKEEMLPKVQELKDKWDSLDSSQHKLILSFVGIAVAIGPIISLGSKMFNVFNTVSSSIGGIGGAIGNLNPKVALIVGAISGLVAICVHAYKTNEEFKETIDELVKSFFELLKPIMNVAKTIGEALMPIVNELKDTFMLLLNKIIVPFLNLAISSLLPILEAIVPIVELVATILTPFIKLLETILVPTLELINSILEPILNLITGIVDGITKLIDKVTKPIKGGLDWLSNLFKDAFNTIRNGFTSMFDSKLSVDYNPSLPNYITGNSLTANNTIGYGGQAGRNSTYNNNVNVYTTSSVFDVDSINTALGGNYL